VTDTTQAALETKAWGDFKTYEEANKDYKLLPEDGGYILRIEKLTEPTIRPWVDLDDKGQPKPPGFQTMITFRVVDYHDPDMIGTTFTQYYKISMHTRANFYKLVKAAFGGDVSPTWRPNEADLKGKLVSAVIAHKEPNDQGQVYPKLESATAYRGRNQYTDVPGLDSVVEDDVPF